MKDNLTIDKLCFENNDMQIQTAVSLLTIKAQKTNDEQTQIRYLKLIDDICNYKDYYLFAHQKATYNTLLEMVEGLIDKLKTCVDDANMNISHAKAKFVITKNQGSPLTTFLITDLKNQYEFLQKKSYPLVSMVNNGLLDCGILSTQSANKVENVLKSASICLKDTGELVNLFEEYNKSLQNDTQK